MGIDRMDYENIEIPMGLSGVLEKAVVRKRKATARKCAEVVMAFAVLLISSNTPTVYAALSEIPVIGEVVKIFHIGSGGMVSDGLKMDTVAEGERLKLVFSQNTEAEEQAADTPAYYVEEYAAPNRVVITVNGIRSYDPEAFIQEAEKCPYVKAAYREILLDDSAVRIVLELQKDTGFEVTEYKEPASLELRLFPRPENEREVWFIRSRKMEMSEELALMSELIPDSKGVIKGTQDGRYIFSIGEFETEEKALQALQEMDENMVSEYSFSVDHCVSSERPE